nr:TetR/AcrR family transcriptional regulator [Kineococcus aurantiacus]
MREAVALFAGSGYRAASLRELATRCGLSLAGLLHHVGSKEALLLAVLEQRDVEDAASIGAASIGAASTGAGPDQPPAPGRERLEALLEVVHRNTSRRGVVELFSVLSAEATSPAHPAHAFFDERYRRVVAALAAAFADCGHPRPESAARRLVAVMDGLQVQWLLHPDDVDMVAEVRAQVDAELAAVSTPPRPPQGSAGATGDLPAPT